MEGGKEWEWDMWNELLGRTKIQQGGSNVEALPTP